MNQKLSRQQFLTLVVLMCGSFVTFLNQTLITPALSTIMVEFSIDTATVQWLVNGFTLVNAIMIPITAYLIDNFSTRRLFLISLSIFFCGSALAGWGPTFVILLCGRLLQAAGAGIIMPMVMTELMIAFPPEHRGQAMGLFGMINAVAPTIGPTLSGFVIDAWNWHVIFYIVCAATVLGFIGGMIVLKSPRALKTSRATLDKPSVALSSLGFGLVLFGFSYLGSLGLSLPVFGTILVGAVTLVFFFRRQLKLEEPMLKVSLLTNRRFALATVLTIIIQAAMMCAPVLVPIYIQTIRGFSATISGLTLMPGAIAMAITNPIAGKLFDKYGPRAVCTSGAFVMTITTACLCFFGADSPLWLLTVVMGVRSMSIAFIGLISTWGMNALDDEVMSHGTSINNAARMIAGSLGTAIIVSFSSMATGLTADLGAQESQIIGFKAAFALSAAICLVGFALCFAYVKNRKEDAKSADVTGERRSMLEQIMKTDVYLIASTATVADAAAMFIEKGVSAVPIVEPKTNRAIGFISDGDILRALSARSDAQYMDPVSLLLTSNADNAGFYEKLDNLMGQPVTSIGHLGLISVDVHDRLSVVCRIMGDNHLKKVPVLDDGKIVGVINRSDITQYAMSSYMRHRNDPAVEYGGVA